jgi:hypothetical protein
MPFAPRPARLRRPIRFWCLPRCRAPNAAKSFSLKSSVPVVAKSASNLNVVAQILSPRIVTGLYLNPRPNRRCPRSLFPAAPLMARQGLLRPQSSCGVARPARRGISVADLNGPQTPAVTGPYPLAYDVAATIAITITTVAIIRRVSVVVAIAIAVGIAPTAVGSGQS